MKPVCFVLLVLLVVPAAGACDPDCVVEKSFCDDEERWHICRYSEGVGRTERYFHQCGEGSFLNRPFCVETSYGIQCAMSDQPVTACTGLPEDVVAQNEGFAHNCDGTAEVVCYGEYLFAQESCRSCTLDGGEDDGIRCDGGLYSACDDDQACADDLTCQSDPEAVAMCTKSCSCEGWDVTDEGCLNDECFTTNVAAWCDDGICRL